MHRHTYVDALYIDIHSRTHDRPAYLHTHADIHTDIRYTLTRARACMQRHPCGGIHPHFFVPARVPASSTYEDSFPPFHTVYRHPTGTWVQIRFCPVGSVCFFCAWPLPLLSLGSFFVTCCFQEQKKTKSASRETRHCPPLWLCVSRWIQSTSSAPHCRERGRPLDISALPRREQLDRFFVLLSLLADLCFFFLFRPLVSLHVRQAASTSEARSDALPRRQQQEEEEGAVPHCWKVCLLLTSSACSSSSSSLSLSSIMPSLSLFVSSFLFAWPSVGLLLFLLRSGTRWRGLSLLQLGQALASSSFSPSSFVFKNVFSRSLCGTRMRPALHASTLLYCL